MENWLNRTENLIGNDALTKLQSSNVAVIGIGGVGSFCAEALARSGINDITLIDNDIVDITNINRQLIADTTTIGMSKVEVMKERILKINPNATVTAHQTFLNEENVSTLIFNKYDFVVDCIDNINSKIALIEYCHNENINIISSMGTGNKLDPTKFEIANISKTSVCPLAKIIRKKLREKNINNLTVVYSKEEPRKINNTLNSTNSIKNTENVTNNSKQIKTSPSSISFVPSVAGLILASEVVKQLTES